MRAHRARRKAAGVVTVTVELPAQDVAEFRALAAQRAQARGVTNPGGMGRGHAARRTEVASGTAAERGTRRAERIAEEIMLGIARRGWPVGASLGSEAALMKRFKVSRTVFRQAVRLLEHHAVARMQRGASGGLVVAEPDLAATVRAASVYLEYRRIRPSDILEVRRVLELAAVRLACERLTPAGEALLREAIAADGALDADASRIDIQRLHRVLGELTGDPALSLFLNVILDLTHAHSLFTRRRRQDRAKVVRRIRQRHRAIAEALLARDAARAQAEIENYIDGFRGWMEPTD
ncbi:MAG: FadR/GntR family transcriptional regulator [Gammaproteobacteria bacterium]